MNRVAALALAASMAWPAAAQMTFPDRLTGDWGGARTRLAERGVTLDADWSHFYQGLASGTGSKSWSYGTRVDAYAGFDTAKLGAWQGGQFKLHAEYFDSNLPAVLSGGLLPTNVAVRLPQPGKSGDLVLSNISLSQRIGDDMNLLIGKINTVDLLAGDPFFGGYGVSRFMNLALVAPPNGLFPPVIMGAVLSMPVGGVGTTLVVFDPEDRTRDYWPDRLFDSGVNVSVSGKVSGRIDGRTSFATLTGIYSTKNSIDFTEALLPPELRTRERSHSWHTSLALGHFLQESAASAWGVFAKLGLSDGNPNPYRSFISGGVAGRGLFASRPDDFFGLGAYHYNLSNVLQEVVNPLVRFDDEWGIEAVYDFAVLPGLHVAADVQVIDPARGANKRAVVAGLRLRLRF